MYLTFAEYQEMGGKLDETTFNDYGFEAQCKIDYYTFNRLKNETVIPENVKRLMYRLISLIDQIQKASIVDGISGDSSTTQAGIASQSNDGVSISYNTLSAHDALDSLQTEIPKLVQQYLSGLTNSLGRKLLYRGLYPGE